MLLTFTPVGLKGEADLIAACDIVNLDSVQFTKLQWIPMLAHFVVQCALNDFTGVITKGLTFSWCAWFRVFGDWWREAFWDIRDHCGHL